MNLDPTKGGETKKIGPCLVISPDEMNRYINTVIVSPMTTKGMKYPTRVSVIFQDKTGQIFLNQIRAIDKSRLITKSGFIIDKLRKKFFQSSMK